MTDERRGPLAGLRVLELGEMMAVPYAGRMFATLGAEVTKVEDRHGGDAGRRYGPFLPDDPDCASGVFAYLNVNKRSVTLNLGTATGRRLVISLAALADVVLVGLTPAQQDECGLTYDALRGQNERVIVCSITPFGRSGPYRDYAGTDLIVAAAGGISVGIGEYGEEPLPLPLFQTDMQAAMAGACASVVALLARPRVGGQQIDISAMDVMAVHHSGQSVPRYVYGGVSGIRTSRSGGHGLYPHTVLPCKDGYCSIRAPQLQQWIRFLHVMGDPEWATNPRYRDRRAMSEEYPEEVDALIIPWLKERTRAELLHIFVENRLPFAPLYTGREVLQNEHLNARGFFAPVPLGRHSDKQALMPRTPYRFSRSADNVVLSGAPELGEDTVEVLRGSLGISAQECEALRRADVI